MFNVYVYNLEFNRKLLASFADIATAEAFVAGYNACRDGRPEGFDPLSAFIVAATEPAKA